MSSRAILLGGRSGLPALVYGSTIQPVSLHRENDNDNEVPGRHTASAGVDIGAFPDGIRCRISLPSRVLTSVPTRGSQVRFILIAQKAAASIRFVYDRRPTQVILKLRPQQRHSACRRSLASLRNGGLRSLTFVLRLRLYLQQPPNSISRA